MYESYRDGPVNRRMLHPSLYIWSKHAYCCDLEYVRFTAIVYANSGAGDGDGIVRNSVIVTIKDTTI